MIYAKPHDATLSSSAGVGAEKLATSLTSLSLQLPERTERMCLWVPLASVLLRSQSRTDSWVIYDLFGW